MSNDVMLYDAYGAAIKRIDSAMVTKQISDLDPTFFHGGVRSRESHAFRLIQKKPYQFHSWVYASGHVISLNLSRLPHVLIQRESEVEKTIREHDVLTLLDKPNQFQTKMQFWEAIVLGLLLPTTKTPGGQVFLIPDSGEKGRKVDIAHGEIPNELFPFNDELVEPILHPHTKGLIGWRVMIPGRDNDPSLKFNLDEVIRIYLFNPYNITQGLSPFSAAKLGVDQDVKASEFNTRAFENDGSVGGVLTSKQPLTEDQRKQMLRAWMERHGGAGNNNGIAVLGLGLEYQQFARTHVDMEFIKQKEVNRDDILAVYGLNDLAFGRLKNIPFANVKEGRRMLWNDTYLPLQETIWESINNMWISNIAPGNMFGWYDASNIQALREDFTEKTKVAVDLITKGNVPPSEAFRLLDIPIQSEKFPHLDSVFINPLLVDITGNTQMSGHEKPECPPDNKTVPRFRTTKEEREQISEEYIKIVLDPGTKSFRAKMERFFFDQRNAMQDLVDEWAKENKDETLDFIVHVKQLIIDPNGFLPDIKGENVKLATIYAPFVEDQMLRETAKLEDEIGPLVEWNVSPDKIQDFVSARAKQIKAINTNTFKKARGTITKIIREGVEERLTIGELAKNLKAGIADVAKIRVNNSVTIARTETGTISSQTRFAAFKDEGIRFHEWVTARDDRVREEPFNHKGEDGNIVEVGKVFPSTGLRMPLDPAGAPGNVISCRCVAVAAKEPT